MALRRPPAAWPTATAAGVRMGTIMLAHTARGQPTINNARGNTPSPINIHSSAEVGLLKGEPAAKPVAGGPLPPLPKGERTPVSCVGLRLTPNNKHALANTHPPPTPPHPRAHQHGGANSRTHTHTPTTQRMADPAQWPRMTAHTRWPRTKARITGPEHRPRTKAQHEGPAQRPQHEAQHDDQAPKAPERKAQHACPDRRPSNGRPRPRAQHARPERTPTTDAHTRTPSTPSTPSTPTGPSTTRTPSLPHARPRGTQTTRHRNGRPHPKRQTCRNATQTHTNNAAARERGNAGTAKRRSVHHHNAAHAAAPTR